MEGIRVVCAVGERSDSTTVAPLAHRLRPLEECFISITGEWGYFGASDFTTDLTFCSNVNVAAPLESLPAFRRVPEGGMARYAMSKRDTLLAEYDLFGDELLGTSEDVCTLRQGRRTVDVYTVAVIDSSKTGLTAHLKNGDDASS